MEQIVYDVSFTGEVYLDILAGYGPYENLQGDQYVCEFFRYIPENERHMSRSLKRNLAQSISPKESSSDSLMLARLRLKDTKKRTSLQGVYRVFLPEKRYYREKKWDANHIYLYMQLLNPSFTSPMMKEFSYSRHLFRITLTEGNSVTIKQEMKAWLENRLKKAEQKLAFAKVDTNKELPLLPPEVLKKIASHIQ